MSATLDRPNVLFILCDQLRWDAIAAHGNSAITTPNLDRLAAEGVSFRRMYSESPLCVPARSVMLTGRPPHRTGVFSNPTPLAEGARTFLHVLRSRGYFNQAIGKMHFRPVRTSHGFDRMWLSEEIPRQAEDDEYLQDLRAAGYGHVLEPHGVRHELYYAAQPSQLPEHLTGTGWVGRRTVEFLEERAQTPEDPFFCWASFIKPHPPFDPPSPWYLRYDPLDMPDPVRGEEERAWLCAHQRNQERSFWIPPGAALTPIRLVRAYYYALVSHIDHWVGRMLDALEDLGLRRRTLVVFTSDHGEYLGDHWSWGKTGYHDASMRVPLLISHPGMLPEGRDVDALAQLADMSATFIGAAGADPCQLRGEGRDLLPLARGDVTRVRDHLLGQVLEGPRGLYCALDGEHKYVYSAADDRELLFRCGSQWDETRNLAGTQEASGPQARLRSLLLDRFREDGYEAAVDGGGWRRYPAQERASRDLDDRDSDARNRQYPLWPASLPGGELPYPREWASYPEVNR